MILITGATGNIGTELVKRLVSKRTPIRIITRDEKKIAHLGPEVGRVIGDRHEPSVVQGHFRTSKKSLCFRVRLISTIKQTDC